MPPLRLIGLFLFITVIFLALMAAATRTSHIDFKRPDRVVAEEMARTGNNEPIGNQEQPPLEFVSVPIVYPLGAVAMLGLLLWFVPAGLAESKQPRRKRRRSRKRKPARTRTGWR